MQILLAFPMQVFLFKSFGFHYCYNNKQPNDIWVWPKKTMWIFFGYPFDWFENFKNHKSIIWKKTVILIPIFLTSYASVMCHKMAFYFDFLWHMAHSIIGCVNSSKYLSSLCSSWKQDRRGLHDKLRPCVF